MTPLNALATALAYVIQADSEVGTTEKAKLVSLLGKHVRRKRITQEDLQALNQDAFGYAKANDFEAFLMAIDGVVSQGQATSIYVNMYDTMLVDGSAASGEKAVVDRFRDYFQIDRKVADAVRDMLMVKNDTTMFLQDDHPCNEPRFRLRVGPS